MSKRVTFSNKHNNLEEIVEYHNQINNSLLISNIDHPELNKSLLFLSKSEIEDKFNDLINELELRTIFSLLTMIEAHFRIDFINRTSQKKKDPLSRCFNQLRKNKGYNISLEEDILDNWKTIVPHYKKLIGEIKSAFKFRHWLAHGKYWEPKLGRQYDYQTIYALSISIIEDFPFQL